MLIKYTYGFTKQSKGKGVAASYKQQMHTGMSHAMPENFSQN